MLLENDADSLLEAELPQTLSIYKKNTVSVKRNKVKHSKMRYACIFENFNWYRLLNFNFKFFFVHTEILLIFLYPETLLTATCYFNMFVDYFKYSYVNV